MVDCTKVPEVGAGVLVTAQPTFANPFPVTASDHAQAAVSAPEQTAPPAPAWASSPDAPAPTNAWLGKNINFVRRRLRAVLRKQDRRPSMGHSEADHRRWPNAFFADQGLFTLLTAHDDARCFR
jgi:hypothetical protein